MNSSDVKIIDITKHSIEYEDQWNQCMQYLKEACREDELYENYLDIDLKKFLNFTAVLYNEEIISFGGVERRADRWGETIVRALTRFWISPKYRTSGLTKWRSDSIKFSPIVLESQLKVLKTMPEIKAVMITREGNYLKSFKEIIRLANTVSEQKFVIMPGRYNVCECMDNPPNSCRQFVAINNPEYLRKAQLRGFFQPYE